MKKTGQKIRDKYEHTYPAAAADSTQNQITIQTQQTGTYCISLVDQSGRVVYETTKKTESLSIVLDVTEANLDTGLYLVKLTSDQMSRVVKIFNK